MALSQLLAWQDAEPTFGWMLGTAHTGHTAWSPWCPGGGSRACDLASWQMFLECGS